MKKKCLYLLVPALWLALLGISAAGAATLGVVGFRKRRKEGAE